MEPTLAPPSPVAPCKDVGCVEGGSGSIGLEHAGRHSEQGACRQVEGGEEGSAVWTEFTHWGGIGLERARRHSDQGTSMQKDRQGDMAKLWITPYLTLLQSLTQYR